MIYGVKVNPNIISKIIVIDITGIVLNTTTNGLKNIAKLLLKLETIANKNPNINAIDSPITRRNIVLIIAFKESKLLKIFIKAKNTSLGFGKSSELSTMIPRINQIINKKNIERIVILVFFK